MLEDVRPGDILEWSYTVEYNAESQLLTGCCAELFTLPAGAPVGKFHFSVLFESSRTMRWKSSMPGWDPVETRRGDEVRWTWLRENHPGLRPEENTPPWFVAYPWIQVSDCPDWTTVAAAYAEAWKEEENDAAAGEIAEQLAGGTGDVSRQAGRAIQLVQEEYRYTAVDWELDGQPPLAASVVVRRRYGDVKDLSFLLMNLLKRMGLRARLVLVNTTLGKALAPLLPAPNLFNHLLVEYEIQGETRWADATFKRQGGIARDYGVGLPVALAGARLTETPAASVSAHVCEMSESILLDTAGGWSTLGIVVSASGRYAEQLREEMAREGLEGMARKRLQDCHGRYGKARRVGSLDYRDDRDVNHFFLAEVFEIKGFLAAEPGGKWFRLDIPNNYIAGFLQTPGDGPRRDPFALPHPCRLVHTIELHAVSLAPAPVQQREIKTGQLHFSRVRKTMAGNWTMRLALLTLAEAVPPDALEEHAEALEEIRDQSEWSILVPAGEAKPRRREDFIKLPASWSPGLPASAPRATPVNSTPKKEIPATAASLPALAENGKGRRRKRRKRDPDAKARWPIFVACVLAVALILIVILVAKYADRWPIFKFLTLPKVEVPQTSNR
jgi:hypothetical protein